MKKILLVAFLASMSLFAFREDEPILQAADPQQPIEVDAGNEFTIMLEANPTTGYYWAIVGALVSNSVEYFNNEYASPCDPNLVYGGGLDIWTFKTVKADETQTTLEYYPPSNDLVNPQHTTTFTVIVK